MAHSLHVVITGGNCGIGYAAAKLFIEKGYRVTIVGRSEEKLKEAQSKLGNVEIGICDLSKRESIVQFVKSISNIDILVNNAGMVASNYELGELDQELTFSTNHLGTMFLTIQLLNHTKFNKGASIVVVSSSLHTKGKDDLLFFDNLTTNNFDGLQVYSQTKLYNILFAKYLQETYLLNYKELDIKVNSVHPGFIPTTNLQRESNIFIKFLMNYILPLFPFTTTVEDAANRIYKCGTENNKNCYYGAIGPESPSELAQDEAFCNALWRKSMDILKLEESK